MSITESNNNEGIASRGVVESPPPTAEGEENSSESWNSDPEGCFSAEKSRTPISIKESDSRMTVFRERFFCVGFFFDFME